MHRLPLPETVFAKVFHFNDDKIDDYSDSHLLPFITNGVITKNTNFFTLVELRDKGTGELLVSGTATCNPHDVPNRKLGFTIAWNRAIKELEYLDGIPRLTSHF